MDSINPAKKDERRKHNPFRDACHRESAKRVFNVLFENGNISKPTGKFLTPNEVSIIAEEARMDVTKSYFNNKQEAV